MMSRNIAKASAALFAKKKPPTPPGLHTRLARGVFSVDHSHLQQKQPVFFDRRDRKYIFVGAGSVGRPTLGLLDQFIDVNYNNVVIVDELDQSQQPGLQKVFNRGAKFIQRRLNGPDWEPFLRSLDVRPYDVVIDLTTDTDGPQIISAMNRLSLMYVNTAQEIAGHFQTDDIYENSLLKRSNDLTRLHLTQHDPNRPTHVYDFGMNPGVISHFAFQGLLDVANHVLGARSDPVLEEYVRKRQYNLIAKHLDLHAIHSSEVDTQIAHNWKPDGTFINTWSVIGLLEEGCEPAQAGWGTHERYLPEDCVIIGQEGVGFKTKAYQKLHESWVPDEHFVGMVIPHGEAFTLNRALAAANYCPTVHYVYRLPVQTKKLMEEMSYEELINVTKWRVLNPYQDQLTGEDKVGALLIFPRNPITGEEKPWTYWYGSILGQGNHEFFGPTSIQVCSGVLTALKYTVQHNAMGPLFPEAVDHDYVMRHTLPFMGKVVSKEGAWAPKSTQYVDMTVPQAKVNWRPKDVQVSGMSVAYDHVS